MERVGGDGEGEEGDDATMQIWLNSGSWRLHAFYLLFSHTKIHYFHSEIFHPGEKFLVRSLQKFALN